MVDNEQISFLNPKEYLLYDLPKHVKPKQKVVETEFFIPINDEFYLILQNNYTVNQLKKICKNYKLPSTGNKLKLMTMIYNYLFFSHQSIVIQKYFKGFLVRKLNKLKGVALLDRSLCNNTNDFFTMQKIKHIPFHQFFSVKDNKNDFVYGFNILSLYQLFLKQKNKATNPYNREKFPIDTFNNVKKIIRLSKILNIKLTTTIEEDPIDYTKQLELRIISLFQNIDTLGNYSNSEWFTSLNKDKLVLFTRELYDIWNHRAQLTQELKLEICPPVGNPFRGNNVLSNNYSLIKTKRAILSIMENMVNNGINDSSRSLGAYYVLAALTLVNKEAAESLPWLYQSVMHNNT
jgi:hypothetical protein